MSVKHYLLPHWQPTQNPQDSKLAGMATRIRKGARPHLYIVEWRESRGLGQDALANRMGVDRTTIWRWETGKRQVKPEIQAQIADALGLERPEDLWRPPAGRPSIDALLSNVPDDDFAMVEDMARRLSQRSR
jgi:transcriptional regulator with XRE-family HTH domain